MVIQYPHNLRVFTPASAPYKDENGKWHTTPAQFTFRAKCRPELNTKAQIVPIGDAKGYLYDYLILLPLGTLRIEDATPIEVYDDAGTLILKSTVRGFYFGQLHSMMWV